MNAIIKLFIWIFLMEHTGSVRCCCCGCDMPWCDVEKTDYGYHWINSCPDCQVSAITEQEFYNEKLGIPYDAKTNRPIGEKE